MLVGLVALTWWLAYATPSPVGHARRLSAGSWALLIVVLVAAVPWLAYANQAASHARAHDYIGSLIDRLVAQAAFPICLLALLIAAVIGWLPIRLAAWPAAAASAGFGFLAIWYPEHQGSPGADWGTAVLAWSACLAVVTEVATRSGDLSTVAPVTATNLTTDPLDRPCGRSGGALPARFDRCCAVRNCALVLTQGCAPPVHPRPSCTRTAPWSPGSSSVAELHSPSVEQPGMQEGDDPLGEGTS